MIFFSSTWRFKRTGFNLAPYPSLTCAQTCLWNHSPLQLWVYRRSRMRFLDYTGFFQIPRKFSRSLAQATALQKESVSSAVCWEKYLSRLSKGVWSTVLIFRSWHTAECFTFCFMITYLFKNNWGLTENQLMVQDEDEHWSFIFNTPKLNYSWAFHE